MTSDGHAISRLHRVPATPGASALQIRAVASELPRVNLEDALAILLALLDREPQTFSRVAARWVCGSPSSTVCHSTMLS